MITKGDTIRYTIVQLIEQVAVACDARHEHYAPGPSVFQVWAATIRRVLPSIRLVASRGIEDNLDPTTAPIISIVGVQENAEVLATFLVSQRRMASPTVYALIKDVQGSIDEDTGHYLYLETDDRLDTNIDCGNARGGVDLMVEDRRVYQLFPIKREACPRCSARRER